METAAPNQAIAKESARDRSAIEVAATLARWFLGAVFLYMGLNKALDPVGFLKLLNEYHLVNQPFLLNSLAAVLPWFEVFCGLLLLAGVGVRGAEESSRRDTHFSKKRSRRNTEPAARRYPRPARPSLANRCRALLSSRVDR